MGCFSTRAGTLSILVIAKPHSRSQSSAVHLDRFLTIIRLFLIIIPPRWGTAAWRILGPDDSFSIQEVLNHLHAVAHLSSSALGHRNDTTINSARLHIVKWRSSAFTLFFMTCHVFISLVKPCIPKHMTGMLLSHVISMLLTMLFLCFSYFRGSHLSTFT